MKNLIYSVAALAVIGLVGCGGGSAGSAPTSNSGGTLNTPVVVNPGVDTVAAITTTPRTPFNLSENLGTPPGLPTE
jgi:hypothetical protein